MGIIHTAKRNIKDELFKKMRAEREFELGRQLTTAELNPIKSEAERQAKEMNLNQVCLCFQAYVKNEATNLWSKLGDPVYSITVNNLKSALYGGLKITRMSCFTSEAKGGQEIFMFVEKLCKSKLHRSHLVNMTHL
jgi:nuclear factor NF-kappa-B p105 subunit